VTVKKPTARERLEQSQLTKAAATGTQGISDTDLEKATIAIKGGVGVKSIDAVTDAVIERTIEGASTLTVSVVDPDNAILLSGALHRKSDIEIDGLWFRLAQIRRPSLGNLDLVFEDREVRLLKTHSTKLGPISRATSTRAEFIERMAKEVKEVNIKTFIPSEHDVQPIDKTKDLQGAWSGASLGQKGIRKDAGGLSPQEAARHRETAGLTVKGVAATPTQIRNANIVLQTGESMNARRKVLVASIMCIIQESTMQNLEGGDRDSVGLFQQRKSMGWPASRDVAKDAQAFFSKAIGVDRTSPNLGYGELVQRVQISAFPDAYQRWRTEAERFVNAYGIPGGDVEQNIFGQTDYDLSLEGDYFFYRGIPPQGGGKWGKENSWDCGLRLAQEVNWRSFMSAGVWYFVTEDYLFKSQPSARITDKTEYVKEIIFDFDEGKEVSNITVTAFMKRWSAPPGSVIEIYDMGPINGRWLVTQASRSLFDVNGEITLKKPLATLPEPSQGNLQDASSFSQTDPYAPKQTFLTATALVNPIPQGMGGNKSAVHNTEGLVGYPAIDFFAKPNTPVLAVENGKIERFSGHNPLLGAVEGPGGPLGWSIYLRGESGAMYYYTHLGRRTVGVGQTIRAGQTIGTVADYDSFGRQSHVHLGVHPPASGHPDIQDLGNAPQAVHN
jgi:hypothetical protein